MGQKVSPVGLRVGVIRDWESRWYAEKDYGTLLIEDTKIREFVFEQLKNGAVGRVEIERSKNRVEVIIRTARPGVVIGQDGANINAIKKELGKIVKGSELKVSVADVKNPDLDANLVAQTIAKQLEERASFRSVQKKAIQRVRKAGAKGCKTLISGRLAGADIARSEGYKEGVVSLHTLRMDVDYALAEADTTYGKLGCKVWISRGKAAPKTLVSSEKNSTFKTKKGE